MKFLVTNDRNFECQYVPISFFWNDCGDNSISGMGGEILYIDNIIYDFTGNVIWNEEDEEEYPEEARIAYTGAPDSCLNYDPLKPSPVRCIEFVYGGVDIICADSIDDPGDLNLNGVANEIADAVIYTNYFIYGSSAFIVNPEGQIAASDVNRDGYTLTVADLVYLIRIISGDSAPMPKVTPSIEARFTVNEGVVNVLIYSFDAGNSFNGEILITDGEILSIDAADYDGNACTARFLPMAFSLNSYPNPFNPVTNIEMNLPAATDWTIGIYNVTGQKVAEFSGSSEAGPVHVKWDASKNASGIYFFKAEAGQYSASKKMLLLK